MKNSLRDFLIQKLFFHKCIILYDWYGTLDSLHKVIQTVYDFLNKLVLIILKNCNQIMFFTTLMAQKIQAESASLDAASLNKITKNLEEALTDEISVEQ